MPKINRPESWDGYDAVDVFEAACRLGRSIKATRHLVKKKLLARLDTTDRRVMIAVTEIESFKRREQPVRLRLLKGIK